MEAKSVVLDAEIRWGKERKNINKLATTVKKKKESKITVATAEKRLKQPRNYCKKEERVQNYSIYRRKKAETS